MCSFFRRASHSPILRYTAVSLLALCWISIASSCHRNEVGSGEIRDAAWKGDLGRVQGLLKGHPDLGFNKSSKGGTPLHWAAGGGHKDVAERLLANRADVYAQAAKRHARLDWACLLVP